MPETWESSASVMNTSLALAGVQQTTPCTVTVAATTSHPQGPHGEGGPI
jgi:hypothetical protein